LGGQGRDEAYRKQSGKGQQAGFHVDAESVGRWRPLVLFENKGK
jgi:hypothetical protein